VRFYEFESKALLAKQGLPLPPGSRVAETATEAKAIAREIGGPVVLKSQVLTGGRMKAGGVLFAETAEEAAAGAKEILRLEINGHEPRGVLVEGRAPIAHEYYASVIYDGLAKLPVMIFSDMGGIDIEEVAERYPEHIAKLHFSTLLPFSNYRAKDLVASLGITGPALNRLTQIVAELARIFLRYDLTLAEINPLARLEDGSFVCLDAHVDMEAEARDRQKAILEELGIGPGETRQARPPTSFEIRGAEIDAVDYRRDRRRRWLADFIRRRSQARWTTGQLL
jgi:succinyl-CoA synthetase beta subunit